VLGSGRGRVGRGGCGWVGGEKKCGEGKVRKGGRERNGEGEQREKWWMDDHKVKRTRLDALPLRKIERQDLRITIRL